MNPLVFLAKLAVENYIEKGEIISAPENLPEDFSRPDFAKFLTQRAGTFVTIFKSNEETNAKELRGCIGTYLPTKENIVKEIISNAIAAATKDYRFGQIQKEELPSLSYTVYVLGEPKAIKNIKKLNPKKYGIIVKTPSPVYKCGLLLPDLEEVDTTEKQISIACQKGGIDPQTETILIFRFAAEKYE